MIVHTRIVLFGLMILLVCVAGCAQRENGSAIRSREYENSINLSSQENNQQDSSNAADLDDLQFAKREIIYTASVRLSVDDFDSFPNRLAQTATTSGGFISESNIARMQGMRRSGRWVIRIPGTKYTSFIESLRELGITESLNEKADDVTDKFVDLDARIRSGRQLEERILKLLEDKGERLENLLTVERELARVRTEIEQMEGQRRLLQSQVAFSTIILTASEKITFQPELAQSFSDRISAEWNNALLSARTTCENVMIWFAANGITLMAWLIGLYLAWLIILRRVWKWLTGEYGTHGEPSRSPSGSLDT